LADAGNAVGGARRGRAARASGGPTTGARPPCPFRLRASRARC